MKKIAFGFAAALTLGLTSMGAPASAAMVSQQTQGVSQATEFSSQYVRRSVTVRRGPFCTTRIVRTRGPMGRVIVRKVRTCR